MKVEPFCEFYGADVDIITKTSFDNSGSNETMQKVLAAIGGFLKKNCGSKILKI